MRRLALILILTGAFAHAQSSAPSPAASNDLKAFAGTWAASLNNSTEEVPFGLEIKVDGDKIDAAVLNGPERWPFSSAKYENGELKLRFDQYDGTLTLHFSSELLTFPEQGCVWCEAQVHLTPVVSLRGEYRRPYSKGVVVYPFQASPTDYTPNIFKNAALHSSLEGDWTIVVGEGDRKEIADARFLTTRLPHDSDKQITKQGLENTYAYATGTVIPVSGDYGLLAGDFISNHRFTLSRFDGIHVMLMKGEVLKDGTLKGLIESGKTGRTPFTGVRKEVAAKEKVVQPPDALTLTKVKDPNEPFRFSAPDFESGQKVSAGDPRFKNKVVMVDIMGTWCPNCHDEEPALVELWKKYHAQGLEIVSLAYEYTNDPAQNKKQIGVYKKRYSADGQLFLIAGTTDEGEIARTLPQLDGFGAYPTTIFVGRDGRVKQIHAGYDGPATGARFDAVKKSMEQTVVELLAEPGN